MRRRNASSRVGGFHSTRSAHHQKRRMSQLSLLPIKLIDEQPADRTKSYDLAWIGFDEQDRRYALKTREPEAPLLPLIEWFCYHLCLQCGIPAPEFAVVVRLDGSRAFGSRWVENAWQFDPGSMDQTELEVKLDRARRDVSAMFAIDAFMPNTDRHFRNMLFSRAGARARALAFDWSRACLFEPWPWPPVCNSALAWAWLSRKKMTDSAAASRTLDRLQTISETEIRSILAFAPEEWSEGIDIDGTANWWRENKEQRAADAAELLKS